MDVLANVDRLHQKRVAAGRHRGGPPAPTAPAFSALVEDLRSLHNVGSIFRTADGAGVSHLYLCGITGCPPHKEIEKTSLGAEQAISWQYEPGAIPVLLKLKKSGITLVGLERCEQSTPLADAAREGRLVKPLCLIVGNEVTGLSTEVLSLCDVICHLPMRGMKESLNVSVAFGIAAYTVADAI